MGRSEAGRRAALFHTGSDTAMSGRPARFGELGILRVDDVDDLLDLAAFFSFGRLPAGRRLAVLTTSAAPALAGGRLRRRDSAARSRRELAGTIRAFIPGFGSARTPSTSPPRRSSAVASSARSNCWSLTGLRRDRWRRQHGARRSLSEQPDGLREASTRHVIAGVLRLYPAEPDSRRGPGSWGSRVPRFRLAPRGRWRGRWGIANSRSMIGEGPL